MNSTQHQIVYVRFYSVCDRFEHCGELLLVATAAGQLTRHQRHVQLPLVWRHALTKFEARASLAARTGRSLIKDPLFPEMVEFLQQPIDFSPNSGLLRLVRDTGRQTFTRTKSFVNVQAWHAEWKSIFMLRSISLFSRLSVCFVFFVKFWIRLPSWLKLTSRFFRMRLRSDISHLLLDFVSPEIHTGSPSTLRF